ncbi:MAG: hypothetical protein IID14_09705, partial [Candidatus Marinimicrobia bacterium]|nr:hypothetical protein [Candidatus Neomarinimicrobiota bacterium]
HYRCWLVFDPETRTIRNTDTVHWLPHTDVFPQPRPIEDVVACIYDLTKSIHTLVAQAGGQVIAVGLLDRMVEIDMQEIISRELTLTGSYASAGEYREALDHLAAGRMVVDPLISEVLPLEQGPRAFERLLKGEEDLLKIILEP